MAKKFEYKVMPQGHLYSADEFEAKLNEFGADGWELINVNQQGNAMSGILKRQLTDEADG